MIKIVRKVGTKEKRVGMMYFKGMEDRKRSSNRKSNVLSVINEVNEPVIKEEPNFFKRNSDFKSFNNEEKLKYFHPLKHITMSCGIMPTIFEIAECQ